MKIQLPENLMVVQSHKPQTLASVGAGDYICCKNAKRVWVVVHFAYGHGTSMVVTLYEATDVAAGTTSAITVTMPIWECADPAVSDEFTRQTDAATFTIVHTSTKNRIVVMQWDPAKFTAGYDCLGVSLGNSNSGNLGSVLFLVEMAYAEDVPPTLITD